MKDFKFINHGVNHVSDFGCFSHKKEGYQHCQHGVGISLYEAILNALFYIGDGDVNTLLAIFVAEHGPIKDTEEITNQANHFFHVTIFYNKDSL